MIIHVETPGGETITSGEIRITCDPFGRSYANLHTDDPLWGTVIPRRKPWKTSQQTSKRSLHVFVQRKAKTMAMLANPAQAIYGGEMGRFDEVSLVLRAPNELADLCVRPMVWHTYAKGVDGKICWCEGQDRLRIMDLDWVEYIPENRDHICDCCGLDIAFCVYRGSEGWVP